MNIALYPGRELPADVIAAWADLQQNEPSLDNPLLHPVWVQLVAAVRSQVEVAVLQWEDSPPARKEIAGSPTRLRGEPAGMSGPGEHVPCRSNAMVGFLPFERSRSSQARPVAACMSDLHGLIARPETPCDMPELLRRCRLSLWQFDHLPAEQPWFAPYHARIEPAAVIELQEGFDVYWQQRQQAVGSWIGQMQRKARKLAREVGPLRLQWHSREPAVLAALVRWKRQQLHQSRFPDVFALPWLTPLLQAVCSQQGEAFAGVLSALYAGDQLVAAHLGICNRHVLVSWIPSYHSGYARYSPGALLHIELARVAAECGIQRIELGRGLNPLKQALGSSARRLAIGAVDLHRGRGWCRERWFQLHQLVHTTPLRGWPLHTYRRLRNWLAPQP